MEEAKNVALMGDELPSEKIAGGMLPKILHSWDMVVIFVAIVLYITNAPGIASAGGVAYIYWALGFITFLIPGAIVTGQLGLMFPGEGSIYLWTNKAMGNFMGFFAGFCAWWPGILSLIVSGVIVVTFIQHLGSLFQVPLLADPWQQGVVILLVLALSLYLSVIRFRVAQNIINVVFAAYGFGIVLILFAALLWLLGGHAPVTNLGSTWGITFGSSGNFTLYGFVITALLGIEVPLNMGVEITNTRAITRYLLWGSAVVMLAYLIGTFGVHMIIPAAGQSAPTAISEVIRIGFGPVGTVFAIIFDLIIIGAFLFNSAVYNYSFGRLLFVSGLDHRLPAIMSRLNTSKVPWVAVVVQTCISALFTIAIFIIGPLFPSSLKPGDLATLMYYIILAAITLIWTLSMCILFIDVIFIRYKYHEKFASIQLAPTPVFYVCAVLGLIASAVAFYATGSAPWVPLIEEQGWLAWVVGIAVFSLLIGVVVYFVGLATFARVSSSQEAVISPVEVTSSENVIESL
ncbi:MAG TPA: amino acid permease [Ktedonobacteraceae bacterium]|nr:amino acid permease [Ktedonobacteraceae bacterium]